MALREAGIRRCPRRCFTCRPTTRSTHNTCPSLRAVPDLVARSHQDMERTIRGQVRINPDWLQRAPGLPCQRACMDHVWVYCRNCDGIHSAEPPVGPCASNHVDALRRWLPLDPVSAQLCQCGVGLWRLARVAVPRLRSPGRSCLGQGTQRRAPESLVVLSIWWGASDRPAPCLLASPLTHRRHPDDFAGGDSSDATLHILQPAPLRRRCLDLAFRRPTHRSHHQIPLTSPSKAKIRPHQANRFSNHAREPCTKSDVSSRWRGLGWRSRRRVGAGLTPRRCPKIERAQ